MSLRERAGDLRNLQRQQSIVLQEGPRNQRITLRIDFSWEDPKTGDRCFGEAKGFETPEWKLKLKLFRARPPGRLEIWGGTYKNPKLMEVVECPR